MNFSIQKLYEEFFYKAEVILKKKGKIVVVARDLSIFKRCSEKFKITEERKVSIGKETLNIVIFEK